MREIKFRAWDKKYNVMDNGCYSDTFIGFDGSLHEIGEYYTYTGGGKTDEIVSDRFVLMQFTGLCDKNGKEIYEGDVVLFMHEIGDQDWSSEIYLVKFKNGAFNIAYSFDDNTSDECTLLGNAYENPELLLEVDE